MEMINRCLDLSEDRRRELELFDREAKRREMISNVISNRERPSADWGNRKHRRRQAALARKGREFA